MSDTAIAPLVATRRQLHRTSLLVAVIVWGCALALGAGVGIATDSHDVAAAEASDEVGSHPAMTTTSTTVEAPAEPLPQSAVTVPPVAAATEPEAPRGDASPHPVNDGVTPSDTPTTTIPEAGASPGASPELEQTPTTTAPSPTTSILEPPPCPAPNVLVGYTCRPPEPETLP